ncbi:hypothetical protein GCM10023322_39880 [Rugosimonospora acidiphila]|uniref:Uncharacterized protein n=1 Tax=Rugosimonospora acidiphila TaxID=556531 RepID=A0ABP9RX71_9ACTN
MSQPTVSVTNGGPDEAINLAMRIVDFGSELTELTNKLIDDIKQVEEQHPEGHDDDYASAYRQGYVKPADQTQKGAVDAGQTVSQSGLDVVNTFAKVGATDTSGGDSIRSV